MVAQPLAFFAGPRLSLSVSIIAFLALVAGGLVARSINRTLGDGRTLKVKELEVELGTKEKELAREIRELREELKSALTAHAVNSVHEAKTYVSEITS